MPADATTPVPPRRRRGRGIRPWLIMAKLLGLMGFLGGLGALAALASLGPEPETIEGWRELRRAMRAIFLPCVFGGLLLVVLSGIALFSQCPRAFLGMRWFRLKVLLLAVLLPGLHLFARGRVLAFVAAIDAGRPEAIAAAWERVAAAFVLSIVLLVPVAVLGRVKPRLAQPFRPPSPPGAAAKEPR